MVLWSAHKLLSSCDDLKGHYGCESQFIGSSYIIAEINAVSTRLIQTLRFSSENSTSSIMNINVALYYRERTMKLVKVNEHTS